MMPFYGGIQKQLEFVELSLPRKGYGCLKLPLKTGKLGFFFRIDVRYFTVIFMKLSNSILCFSVEEGFDLSQDTKFRVQIFPDGTVFWGPSMKWRTYCEVNLLHFPYDVQTCNISFINWIYAEEGTVFHPTQTEVILKKHFPE